MAKDICGQGRYVLGGPNEDSIGLPVSISKLPEKINVEGYSLSVRTSFHITLVAIGKIMKKYKVVVPDFIDKVVDDFCEFTQKKNIDLSRFHDELKFASEKEKRSIVMMCDISSLNHFFDLINEKYGLQVEYPPTHATLYTLQQDKGIFLTDSKDIETMTKPIENPGIKLEWKKFGRD